MCVVVIVDVDCRADEYFVWMKTVCKQSGESTCKLAKRAVS